MFMEGGREREGERERVEAELEAIIDDKGPDSLEVNVGDSQPMDIDLEDWELDQEFDQDPEQDPGQDPDQDPEQAPELQCTVVIDSDDDISIADGKAVPDDDDDDTQPLPEVPFVIADADNGAQTPTLEEWAEDSQPIEWQNWNEQMAMVASNVHAEEDPEPEPDPERTAAKIAARILEGLPAEFMCLFLSSKSCKRNLILLPEGREKWRPSDIYDNKAVLEAFVIEFPKKTPTLMLLHDVVLQLNELTGGAMLKADKKTLGRVSRFEAWKLRALLSYMRQLARKNPRSRDQRLQHLKALVDTPVAVKAAKQKSTSLLWEAAMTTGDEDEDDDDDPLGIMIVEEDSQEVGLQGDDQPHPTDTVHFYPDKPTELVEEVAALLDEKGDETLTITPSSLRDRQPGAAPAEAATPGQKSVKKIGKGKKAKKGKLCVNKAKLVSLQKRAVRLSSSAPIEVDAAAPIQAAAVAPGGDIDAGGATLADLHTKFPSLDPAICETLLQLPRECWPQDSKTGRFNYTLYGPEHESSSRPVLEVQLKNKCFYMKKMSDGSGIKTSPTVAWKKYDSTASAFAFCKAHVKWDGA